MYEHFRNELIANLRGMQGSQRFLAILDVMQNKWQFQKKETAITVYKHGLPQIVKFYLAAKITEGLSRNTILLYKQILKLFFQQIKKNPQQITANDIRLWIYSYKESNSVSNRTLDTYRTILDTFFQWAFNEEYITKNPCSKISSIKYQKKQRNSLTQMQLQYVRSACKTKKQKAIIQFFYSTGCRVSQLTNVKKQDVNFETKEVMLLGKGNKYRTGYLNAKAILSLCDYLNQRKDDDEHLFVRDRAPYTCMSSEGVQYIIRRITERIKDKTNKVITPHIFRHTTATVAVQNGMPIQDVQRMLGHANIATTMIYAEVQQQEVKTIHQKTII